MRKRKNLHHPFELLQFNDLKVNTSEWCPEMMNLMNKPLVSKLPSIFQSLLNKSLSRILICGVRNRKIIAMVALTLTPIP